MTFCEQQFLQLKNNDRQTQKAVFEMFSAKMIAIAKSYTGNLHDAEDVAMHAFYKCFTRISDCRSAPSFPAWLRAMVVNDAISHIRKKKNIMYLDADLQDFEVTDDVEEPAEVNVEKVLQEMPEGYRLVFNLAVFEEKKHTEIAEILNISIGTSKSQLCKAKKWVSEFLKKSENGYKQLD